MSNKFKSLIKVSAPLFLVAFGTPFVYAQQSYTYYLLAPLPGGPNTLQGNDIFVQYAPLMFAFMLSIAATLAFIMIVIGGIEYLASGGNPNTKSDAKSRITSALWGLLLAAACVLILRTINPDLIRLSFNIPNLAPINALTPVINGPVGGGIGALIGGALPPNTPPAPPPFNLPAPNTPPTQPISQPVPAT